MAPHLNASELGFIFMEEGKGTAMKAIHGMLRKRRAKQGLAAPCLRCFSEAVRRETDRMSQKETRGRKRVLNRSKKYDRNALQGNTKRQTNGSTDATAFPLEVSQSQIHSQCFYPSHKLSHKLSHKPSHKPQNHFFIFVNMPARTDE